jgi:hypothetical protein
VGQCQRLGVTVVRAFLGGCAVVLGGRGEPLRFGVGAGDLLGLFCQPAGFGQPPFGQGKPVGRACGGGLGNLPGRRRISGDEVDQRWRGPADGRAA